MNVQGIEWVADFMSDAGGEQSQRVQALRLDCLLFAAPTFSDVTKNDRVSDLFARGVDFSIASRAGALRRRIDLIVSRLTFDYERDAVEIDEAVRRIKDFHVAADRAFL